MAVRAILGKTARKYKDGWRFLGKQDYDKLDNYWKKSMQISFVDANFGKKTYVAVAEWSDESEILDYVAENELKLRKFENFNNCVQTDAKYVVIL